MAEIQWVAKVLKDAGCKVYEMPGWQTSRTRGGFEQLGIVCHHTATGRNVSDEAVRNLLRNGRSDLKGPLSQLGLRRDGTFDIIAAGRCNHNGYGEWGNDSIGIEAYNDGVGEPWPRVQMDAYAKGCAAICKYLKWTEGKVKGHKETDPGRKIDPTFDMREFRFNVKKLLVPSILTPTDEEDQMFTLFYVEQEQVYYSMTPWAISKLSAGEGFNIDSKSTGLKAVVVDTTATWNKIKKNAPV